MNSIIKFDWDDINIVPSPLSDISSRSEINIFNNGKLPLMTAPMDMVIDESNVSIFEDNNIQICFPRNVRNYGNYPSAFFSFGLDELEMIISTKGKLPCKVLIDVANGNMLRIFDLVKNIKSNYTVEIMAGNIANPETYALYCEAGIDYARIGVGGGSACTTSANSSIHFPMASLIAECYEIKQHYVSVDMFVSKIVADGGFKKFPDVIKALAIGADVVMIGGIFNKALESCSENFIHMGLEEYQPIDKASAIGYFKEGGDIFKYYRGMSTKEVQSSWGSTKLKTSEGISMYNKVEYTLPGWISNFNDYLKSAMSYCNIRDISDFSGGVEFVQITQHAFNRFFK